MVLFLRNIRILTFEIFGVSLKAFCRCFGFDFEFRESFQFGCLVLLWPEDNRLRFLCNRGKFKTGKLCELCGFYSRHT